MVFFQNLFVFTAASVKCHLVALKSLHILHHIADYVPPTEGWGGHIAFGADPVGVCVVSYLHSIS